MSARTLVHTLKSRSIVRHFVKYSIVGAWNTVLFLGILNVARSAALAFALAYAVAFVVASFNSFVLNRLWTFRDREHGPAVRQYLVFIFFTGIGLVLGEFSAHALLSFLHQFGRIGENIAALGAVPVSVLWNFLAYRRWTFKHAPASG